ncbi:hypothetical protein THIOM_004905 [Candidatus Thiomargarita nelsonii]|uniref:Uncharacterized protein n=1 Tax=Candidatus Thiomargarita nelsonii TaxID=1003181 RepID=A0A176RUP4_9GAMM|nr:hypothetical protein THIOM_004905 [Candidatus Thiomargarita nelsonii]
MASILPNFFFLPFVEAATDFVRAPDWDNRAPGYEHTTPLNDDGRGNLIYLDRHHVDCGNKGLVKFRLFRRSRGRIAYQYSCGSRSMGQITTKRTGTNNDGNGNIIFLDRHHVNCGNKALLGFRLFRPTGSTIAYKYTCGSRSMGQITTKRTGTNDDGNGNLIFLDRHHVDCGNKVLLGFRLFRPTGSTIAYEYTCGY